MSNNQKDDSIFPASLSLKALASTSYKNTAYALAEIVDNSSGASAQSIHVAIICKEDNTTPNMIAILDNGKGMDKDTLRHSIQYGNGENVHTKRNERKGLGRFGVGLLSATFNQCHFLGIWSWQNGIDQGDQAMHVELNALLMEGHHNILPTPDTKPLPNFFRTVFHEFKDMDSDILHGTLVLWQDFHNLKWKTTKTLAKHLKFECGRIYRKLINENKLEIVLSVWSHDFTEMEEQRVRVGVVDPLFLEKWDDPALKGFNKSLFEPYNEGVAGDNRRSEDGEVFVKEFTVKDDDGNLLGYYSIQSSLRRRPDVVDKAKEDGFLSPGSAPYGKLAERLRGVSILREGRELILDTKWLPPDQTTARWLGVSVDFSASLDELFGVDNSKQRAHHLQALAGSSKEDIAADADNHVVKNVALEIRRLIFAMHSKVKEELKKSRTKTSEDILESPVTVSDGKLHIFSQLTATRSSEGYTASYDEENPADNPHNLKKNYEGTLITKNGIEDSPAENDRPTHVIEKGHKIDYVYERDGGAEFFNIRPRQGVLLVVLNKDHPFFERLSELCVPAGDDEVDDNIEEENNDKLTCEERLQHAQQNLRNAMWVVQRLLFSYARAECEARREGNDEFQEMRIKWGRIVKMSMKDE